MIVEKKENAKTFTLKEIANWTNEDSGVSIPAIQRGLVWAPKQIEFLWDSILRTFPIGGFVLSENKDDSFYLMDGQQRYNAIRTAFQEPRKGDEIMLWMDLIPKENPKSTRKYFIKATTTNHPWGFKDDDECQTLNALERRKALELFQHKNENLFKIKIDLLDTFPTESVFPIPFSFLLNSSFKNKEEFSNCIIEKINTLSNVWKKNFSEVFEKKHTPIVNYLEEQLFPLLQKLLETQPYRVPCSILYKEAMEQEFDINSEMDKTNLEILFIRLNKGGTTISQDDLYYSAIKAYWDNRIKETIDNLAKDRMPPQNLAMFFFRLALTINDDSALKFVGELSIKQIRQYAKDEQKKQQIEDFIINESQRIIDKVYEVLIDIPKYLIMKIITRKKEIFLVLMYLAYRNFDLKVMNADKLIMLLYWFSSDWVSCVNELFKCFKNVPVKVESAELILEVRQKLCDLTIKNQLINIYSPDIIQIDVASLKRPKYENAIDAFWDIISDHKHNSFLIFAERDFLKEYFPEYNPANIRGWDKINCPWDYDHIIPKSWSDYKYKWNTYKNFVDYWLWRIGNFAAIPFEENRSKNKYNDFEFYKKDNNEEMLYFDEKVTRITENFVYDKNEAELFGNVTYERTLKIYKKCYDFILPWLPVLSEDAKKRKDFFLNLNSNLKNFKFFYTFGSKDFETSSDDDNGWMKKTLSFAMPLSNDLMVSFTWSFENNNQPKYEIGLRKNYNQTHLNNSLLEKIRSLNFEEYGFPMGDWWYLCKRYTPENFCEKDCIDQLKKLCNLAEKEIL